jgi:hypothetical protein
LAPTLVKTVPYRDQIANNPRLRRFHQHVRDLSRK